MEETSYYDTIEQARNAALAWCESLGAPIGGPYYDVVIGRIGPGLDHEVGVAHSDGSYRRLRLDYDPTKGCHYNAEVGKGSARKKQAFCFPGSEDWLTRIMHTRPPR